MEFLISSVQTGLNMGQLPYYLIHTQSILPILSSSIVPTPASSNGGDGLVSLLPDTHYIKLPYRVGPCTPQSSGYEQHDSALTRPHSDTAELVCLWNNQLIFFIYLGPSQDMEVHYERWNGVGDLLDIVDNR